MFRTLEQTPEDDWLGVWQEILKKMLLKTFFCLTWTAPGLHQESLAIQALYCTLPGLYLDVNWSAWLLPGLYLDSTRTRG